MSETQVARRTMGRLAQILEEEISRAMVTATRAACGRVLLELAREEDEAPAPMALPEAGVALEAEEPPAGQVDVAAAAAVEPESEPPVAPEPAPEEVATKVCKRCGQEKPLSEFHRNGQALDGHRATCKACEKRAHLEKKDPGYASGLSTFIEKHHAGEGECPHCGETGHLYRPNGDEGLEALCYPCLQREKIVGGPGCAVCGAPTRPKQRGQGYTMYCSSRCRLRAYREKRSAGAQGGDE
jgi:hypothetical protein